MAVGGRRDRGQQGKAFCLLSSPPPQFYTLTSWTTRSGREPEGTSLLEGHRSLRVQLVSGANQPDHNDIIRATALEGHGLVFLGRVPTPTAAALVRSCPAGVGVSFSRRLAMARPGGLGLRPGLMLTWPWSVLLCPGLWALWALCLCGRYPRKK